MPKTFMRGLAMLELLDLHGPLTVGELARLAATDKSIVSRTLSACESDGWIVRVDGRVALGPRAALLAHATATATLVRQAQPLVEAISGVTGLTAHAYALVGRRAVVIASSGRDGLDVTSGLAASIPLFATAAGKAIAAQLDPDQLDRVLPPDPFPDATAEFFLRSPHDGPAASRRPRPRGERRVSDAIARTRRELDRQLEAVRAQGAALDFGELHPELACVAIPWPRSAMPAALACMSSPAAIRAGAQFAREVLSVAAAPTATRADIAAASVRAG
jgi:DNA-binding IclR family transcriptional regulator